MLKILRELLTNTKSGGTRILTSAQLAEAMGAGTGTPAGQNVTNDTAMRVITVFASVNLLAKSVGRLPCLLYREGTEGRTLIKNHPVATLLRWRPNGWQTAFEFQCMMMGHLALRGNAYARIIRVGNVPKALIPMHPDMVSVEQRIDGSLIYTGHSLDGRKMTLQQSEILHLRGLSASGIVGINPIAAARNAIGLAQAVEDHGSRLFSNGAQTGTVLKHPGNLGPEAQKRLINQFDERHAGSENAYKTLLLEEGMDITSVGMTAEDSQFLETRKFQRTEIATLFGVPPHMVGDLERATFSNIEHQALEFVRNCLEPWLECWEQAIKRDLLWGLEGNSLTVDFDTHQLTQGDFLSLMQAFQIAVNTGLMNPNEVRERISLNPRDGGDVYRQTPNSVPEGATNNEAGNGSTDQVA